MRRIADLGKSGGIAARLRRPRGFIRAGEYLQKNRDAHRLRRHQLGNAGRAGGAAYGLSLFGRCRPGDRLRPTSTFAWGSDARGVAHVHVVIIGLDRPGGGIGRKERLFGYPDTSADEPVEKFATAALSPYLFDAGRPWMMPLFDGAKTQNSHRRLSENRCRDETR